MIDQQTLFTYLLILLGFVFIPGPAVLLTLARASAGGTRVGLATGLGIAAGDLVHTLMAVVGISALLLTSALLFGVVKFMGAAYLVYLGIRAFVEKVEPVGQPGKRFFSAAQAFRQAVLAEVMNPKTALFFLAFLPQFVNPANGLVSVQLLTLGVMFVAAGLFATVVVAIAAGKLGVLLRSNAAVVKWQGRVVGSIYCALGLRVALQEK